MSIAYITIPWSFLYVVNFVSIKSEICQFKNFYNLDLKVEIEFKDLSHYYQLLGYTEVYKCKMFKGTVRVIFSYPPMQRWQCPN